MIVQQKSRRYWYLKTKSERLFAGVLILPPAFTMCIWSGLYMNENPKLFLLHIIGWAGLIGFWRRFMIVEGIALIDEHIRIWNGPIVFGLFWHTNRIEFSTQKLKWQSIQKKEAPPQSKYRIQLSGNTNSQRQSWVFQRPFKSRKSSRAFLSQLRDLTHSSQT